MAVAAAPFVVDSGAEGQLVELPALQALCGEPGRAGAGWTYVHGTELAPDAPVAERKLWSDVVLVERFAPRWHGSTHTSRRRQFGEPATWR